ncbi:prepilin peptidase, partial [bacterium]|nr:prepilin peptidase [bacterium]
MVKDIAFLSYLAVCAATDVKYRKVFNFVTFPAIILGVGLNFFYFGTYGLKNSLIGLIAGFLVLFVFFLLGGVGPGDFKFLAGAGAITGWEPVLWGFLYGAIIAGIYSLCLIIVKKKFKETLKRIGGFFVFFLYGREAPDASLIGGGALPYAFFLAVGL